MTVMDGIGKMLSFQAKAIMLQVRPADARNGAIKKITGIKLNSRLRSEHLHHPSGVGFFYAGGEAKVLGLGAHHKIVVIAGGYLCNAGSDGGGFGEVQGSAVDAQNFTRRQQCCVGRGVEISGDKDFMAQDISLAGSTQVKIGMVGHVDGGGFIRCGMKLNDQVFLHKAINNLGLYVTGKALFHVRAEVGKYYAATVLVIADFRVPQAGTKSLRAAMDGVRAVVGRKFIRDIIEKKSATGDAVGDPSDCGSQMRMFSEVAGERGKSQHNISHFSGVIGRV